MTILGRFFLCLLLLWVPTSVVHAQATEPAITRIEPRVEDGRLVISADVDFELNPELRDAAERGLPLYITADLTITSARWWWFDRTDIDTQQTWRIVFNALTRQWRVGSGELNFPVASLDDALGLIRNIRNWNVIDVDALTVGTVYSGQMRVRLNNTMLPRPFQVNALNSSAWSVSTGWMPFSFEIGSGQVLP